MNVFDIVDEFYTQDPEWNFVLEHRHIDNYLRSLAWQGVEDDELIDVWSNIMLLCIFLGNNERFAGDMSRDNFIDCVGWCGRNVAGFKLNVPHVKKFLENLSGFYTFLFKKKIILNDKGPREALARLVQGDTLQLLDSRGKFLSDVEKHNLYASPDLPAKIFINVGENMDMLLDALRGFYEDKAYYRDVERAAFLYSGVVLSGAQDDNPESEEYVQGFWDYFLFDYHLLSNDKHPIQHFYDISFAPGTENPKEDYFDILLELLKTRLVLFSVERANEDGTFNCRDLLTQEGYVLSLPIYEELETRNVLFMGHIYYNESMIVNFVRGFRISVAARKRMLKILERAKAWFAVRKGGALSWQEFVKRNNIFLRHICLLYSVQVPLDCFNYTLQNSYYRANAVVNDAVTELIGDLLRPYSFSAYDISLCCAMWSDFLAATGKRVRMPEIWAAGIIRNFIDINGIYDYDLSRISEMCRSIPAHAISRTSNEIGDVLELELHDPRYVNEEGMVMMLFS